MILGNWVKKQIFNPNQINFLFFLLKVKKKKMWKKERKE